MTIKLTLKKKENDAKLSRAKKIAHEQREIQAAKGKQLENLKIEVTAANKEKKKLRSKVSKYVKFRNFFDQVNSSNTFKIIKYNFRN